ncbi:transposon Ty3-I Gag-Pol polyprotein [Trichonephila clavipes]|uniref:Transposon Ty3-I Gag-Pol polyprotein n=1 Tax=Trichonephila clavipes TaxID=2585209 RepID=A0A8X6VZ33_TRICX|nr:transposon Ty3-I Gag-Pol polyprotein [Trichonephila clavipes]
MNIRPRDLISVFHPQAIPLEKKNCDLKPRLAILVGDQCYKWDAYLPILRFAKNTEKCDTTGQTTAFFRFYRELRTTHDVNHDLYAVIDNNSFVSEITPYLKEFLKITSIITERVEQKQDEKKKYADPRR